jgi:GTP-binding protein
LGIQFLKHLGRTRLLLHLVDVSPYGGSGDPIDDARKIIAELAKYSDDLVAKQRWLVLNKIDQLPEDERDARCCEIVEGLDWQGPVFHISALSGIGTQELTYKIMDYLEAQAAESALAHPDDNEPVTDAPRTD